MTDRLISEQALRNELELNTKWINSHYTDVCIRRTPTAQMPAEAAAEYESARARAHNLNLYLDFVRQVDKTLWSAMMDEFDGMPGFTEHADGYKPDWMEGADNDVH